jgi:hypothetical protein
MSPAFAQESTACCDTLAASLIALTGESSYVVRDGTTPTLLRKVGVGLASRTIKPPPLREGICPARATFWGGGLYASLYGIRHYRGLVLAHLQY